MSAILREPMWRLRPMTQKDVGAVHALEQRAYAFPWSEGIFRDCLRAGYCCWVLDLEREVIGYGVLSVAAGESHLLNLCVDPARQGNGLGRRLLKRMIELARYHDATTLFLEVRVSNRVAIHLYESVGFNEVGVRHRYYPARDGLREDALIMALTL